MNSFDKVNHFLRNLEWISSDLKKYADKKHAELFRDCIQKKLAITLQRYDFDLDLNADFLSTQENKRVLKAITKIQRRDDVRAIEQLIEQDQEERE